MGQSKRRQIFGFNQYERDVWVAAQAKLLPTGSRLLDVGAGTGPYRHLFQHCQYFSHDFAQESGTVGRYTALDYVSDINQIPVPSDTFDAILCTEVLEHVPEPLKAFEEFHRILRPGGVLLLTAPLGSFLHQEPYHFFGGFTPHFYERFLPETGFDVIAVERNGGFFSLFGQEALKFAFLTHPRRNKLDWRWPFTAALWLVTWPTCRLLLPVAARYLDGLNLENIATVGYHVVARKAGK